MSRRSFRVLVALSSMCTLLVSPAHSQPELAGHPLAPEHAAAEALPVTFPDGAGGLFAAFKGAPLPGDPYGAPSVYVAHADAIGEPFPGWTPVAIGSLYNRAQLPPILVATGPGRAWVAPDYYYSTGCCTPYLVRAVGASGPTLPDSSRACDGDRRYNSLAEIAPDRVLITSKLGPVGLGTLSLAILEPTGELKALLPVGLPGNWRFSSTDDERGPVTVADGAGGAWVLSEFTPTSNPNERDVAALHVAADGSSALSPSYRVVCGAPRDQSEARAAVDAVGGAFIVWTDRRDLVKAADVFASHLLADGSFAPGVPIQGRAIASLVGDQFQPQSVSDGSGGAWLAWTDSRSGENDLYYTHIGSDCVPRPGFPVGGRALCAAAGSQIEPQLAADGEGGFYAVWLDQRDGELDLYGQHIHATGVVMPGWIDDGLPICTEGSAQTSPSVVLSSPHHAIATWSDTRTGYEKIYASALPEDGSTTGAPFGGSPRLSLAPVVNPVRSGIELRVTSPDDGPIRVTLVDVSGRVRAEQVVAGPTHDARLRFEAPGPGLYFLRAEQRGTRTSGRVAVVR